MKMLILPDLSNPFIKDFFDRMKYSPAQVLTRNIYDEFE